MSTFEQALSINGAMSRWFCIDSLERAQVVIAWCEKNGVTYTLPAVALEAAMKWMPSHNQRPDHYLNFVQGFHAAQVAGLAAFVPTAGILTQDCGPTP